MNIKNIIDAIKIAKHAQNVDTQHVKQLIAELNHEISSCHTPYDVQKLFSSVSTESLSFLLYNLGYLVSKETGHVDAAVVLSVLRELRCSKDFTNKMIANALYGAGLIVKKKCLNPVNPVSAVSALDGEDIEVLLNVLLHNSLRNNQNIANSLYGIGLFSSHVRGEIDAGIIATLLQKLRHKQDVSTQHIANSLYGLSKLAELRVLKPSELLQPSMAYLLAHVNVKDFNIQGIFQVLQSLVALPLQSKASIESLFEAALAKYLHPSDVVFC